jgi:putative copper resistance protein D
MLTLAWYTTILLSVGAVSAGHALAQAPRWPRRLTSLALYAVPAMCTMVSWRLWSQTYDAFGGDQPLELAHAQVILFETSWGTGWLWQASASAVTLLLVMAWRQRWSLWPLAAVAATVTAFTTALNGHAMAMEDRVWMTVAAHGLHVVAACWWLGGLAAIQLVTLGADFDRDPQVRLSLSRVIDRFSPIAVVAVTLLVVAGGVATWRHVIEPAGIDGFASPYGLAVLGKVAAFGAAGVCGLYNWRVLRPQLAGSPEAARQLRGLASLEIALGLIALVLTALLGTLSMPEPPGGGH